MTACLYSGITSPEGATDYVVSSRSSRRSQEVECRPQQFSINHTHLALAQVPACRAQAIVLNVLGWHTLQTAGACTCRESLIAAHGSSGGCVTCVSLQVMLEHRLDHRTCCRSSACYHLNPRLCCVRQGERDAYATARQARLWHLLEYQASSTSLPFFLAVVQPSSTGLHTQQQHLAGPFHCCGPQQGIRTASWESAGRPCVPGRLCSMAPPDDPACSGPFIHMVIPDPVGASVHRQHRCSRWTSHLYWRRAPWQQRSVAAAGCVPIPAAEAQVPAV
jgi:hypothetical protein